jgi:hypothetical protein
MRRPRGPGGRFLTGEEIRALEQQEQQQAPQESSSRPQSANGTNDNADPVSAAAEVVEA